MHRPGIILTIGGGGFTHGTDPALDEACLRFASPRPSLGYLGWANGDDALRIARFYARFDGGAAALSHLPLGATAAQAREWLRDKDLVYLAGGNTADLVAALSAPGMARAFEDAHAGGCVLAGVSAGGVCWFDWVLSDAGGTGYQPIHGLAMVEGGVCPHYSSEPARQPRYHEVLAARPPAPAFAVDDGACLVAVDGTVRGCLTARHGRAGYRLTSRNGTVVTSNLPRIAGADVTPGDPPPSRR